MVSGCAVQRERGKQNCNPYVFPLQFADFSNTDAARHEQEAVQLRAKQQKHESEVARMNRKMDSQAEKLESKLTRSQEVSQKLQSDNQQLREALLVQEHTVRDLTAQNQRMSDDLAAKYGMTLHIPSKLCALLRDGSRQLVRESLNVYIPFRAIGSPEFCTHEVVPKWIVHLSDQNMVVIFSSVALS